MKNELTSFAKLTRHYLMAELLLLRQAMANSPDQLVSTRALAPRIRAMEKILNEFAAVLGETA